MMYIEIYHTTLSSYLAPVQVRSRCVTPIRLRVYCISSQTGKPTSLQEQRLTPCFKPLASCLRHRFSSFMHCHHGSASFDRRERDVSIVIAFAGVAPVDIALRSVNGCLGKTLAVAWSFQPRYGRNLILFSQSPLSSSLLERAWFGVAWWIKVRLGYSRPRSN